MFLCSLFCKPHTAIGGSQKSRNSAEVKFNGLLKTLHKAESHICNNIKCSFYLYSARVLKRTCFAGCSHVIIIFSAKLEQMWCKCSLKVFYGHQNCTIKIRWHRRMNVLGCAVLVAVKRLFFIERLWQKKTVIKDKFLVE